MAKIGRPPVLGIGHQILQVGLYGIKIQALEFFGIIKALTHRVGLG